MERCIQISEYIELSICKINTTISSYGRIFKKRGDFVFEFCMIDEDTLIQTNNQAFLIKIKVHQAFFDKYEEEVMYHTKKQKLNFKVQSILFELVDIIPQNIEKKILIEANSLFLIQQLLVNSNPMYINKEIDGSPLNEEKVSEAEKYILKNLSQKLTIPQIANKIGTNQGYLKTSFKILKGETIYFFIKRKRMTLAKHLILTSNLSISDIAHKVGYSSLSSFSQAFSSYYGVKPSMFVQSK